MADNGADSVQQRIQIARRDAEALKDRIKRKKDELADTTCTLIACCALHCNVCAHVQAYHRASIVLIMLLQYAKSPGSGLINYLD